MKAAPSRTAIPLEAMKHHPSADKPTAAREYQSHMRGREELHMKSFTNQPKNATVPAVPPVDLTRTATVCVYCKAPATATGTGVAGTYHLCPACARSQQAADWAAGITDDEQVQVVLAAAYAEILRAADPQAAAERFVQLFQQALAEVREGATA